MLTLPVLGVTVPLKAASAACVAAVAAPCRDVTRCNTSSHWTSCHTYWKVCVCGGGSECVCARGCVRENLVACLSACLLTKKRLSECVLVSVRVTVCVRVCVCVRICARPRVSTRMCVLCFMRASATLSVYSSVHLATSVRVRSPKASLLTLYVQVQFPARQMYKGLSTYALCTSQVSNPPNVLRPLYSRSMHRSSFQPTQGAKACLLTLYAQVQFPIRPRCQGLSTHAQCTGPVFQPAQCIKSCLLTLYAQVQFQTRPMYKGLSTHAPCIGRFQQVCLLTL